MSGEPVELISPFDGVVAALADVPDPVFSEGIVGPGLAIKPGGDADVDVCSPIAGTIAKIHPHAFVVSDGEVNALVHLGLDTVKLKGEGFTLFAEHGATVAAGDRLIRWNPASVRESGMDTICPIVFLDTTRKVTLLAQPGTTVTAGQPIARLETGE